MSDENTPPPPYRSSPSWFGTVKESAKTRGDLKKLAATIAEGKSAKAPTEEPEPAKDSKP